MMKLKSIQVINSNDRISSVDLFRAIAIVSVVLFHFNNSLPYGYLGVDLFFVISGLLIGGILTKDFTKGNNISYLQFILQRGRKIWPLFYFFIITGNIAAYFLYHKTHPNQIIPLWDIKRYIFFYQNYTGLPLHWSFDHIWSLCVEEHFYLILPIMFILAQRIKKNDYKLLLLFTILTIIAGITSKYMMLVYSHSQDTSSATHNRIDALAWGVLLNIIINCYGNFIRNYKNIIYLFPAGIIIFISLLYFDIVSKSVIYHKVIFQSLTPVSFFLMILGVYFINFKEKTKALAIVAYQ